MKLTKEMIMEFLNSGFLEKRNASFSEGKGMDDTELFGAIHKNGKDYVLVLDSEGEIQNLSVLFCEIFPDAEIDTLRRACHAASDALWVGRGAKVIVNERDKSASFCLSFPTQMTSDLEFTLDYAMDSLDISAIAFDEALEEIIGEEEKTASYMGIPVMGAATFCS